MTNPHYFDPDELFLEKKEIVRLIEVVQKRLRKTGGWKHKFYLAGLAAFKQGILLVSDDIVKFVWRDLVQLTNKMIEYNARKRMLGEMPKTADMLKMLEDEIELGKFVGDPIDDKL